MGRFYNCFIAIYSYFYTERTRVVRIYKSSYGNGNIQVVVPTKTRNKRY